MPEAKIFIESVFLYRENTLIYLKLSPNANLVQNPTKTKDQTIYPLIKDNDKSVNHTYITIIELKMFSPIYLLPLSTPISAYASTRTSTLTHART